MSDFPLGGYTYSETIGATTAASLLTAVTSGATNTKGAWTELAAATARATDFIIIYLDFVAGGAAIRDVALDIAIGGAGSEVIIMEDLHTQLKSSIGPAIKFHFPVRIPKGVRVSARIATNASADVFSVGASLFTSKFKSGRGYSKVKTLGIVGGGNPTAVAVDPGGTANTKGAWTEIVAATPERIQEFSLCIGGNTNNAHIDATFLADIAVGGAGSEVILVENIYITESSAETTRSPTHFPIEIPAGSRVAMRMQSSIIDPTDRVLSFAIAGVS